MRFYRTIKSFDFQGRYYTASEVVPFEDFEAFILIKRRLIDARPVQKPATTESKKKPETRKKKKVKK